MPTLADLYGGPEVTTFRGVPLSEIDAGARDRGISLSKLAETWPAKMARSAYDAVRLPGQVASGQLATQPQQPGMWSDVDEARQQATQGTMMNRAVDLAGVLMLGSGAVPAGANELRAGIRPYQNVPDTLMGYGRNDAYKGKSFDSGNYPHTQQVEVVFPGMFGGKPEVMRDAIMGMNPEHAIERAYRNWPGAWHIRGVD